MNILELNFERIWRGGEKQSFYNMQGFRNAGITVDLICRKGYPLEKKALKEGFNVYSFNSIFGVVFFLIKHGRKYEVMHAQTSHILTYCVFTKPFHKVKIIFTRRVNFRLKAFFTKQKYILTDKIIGISSSVKNIITDFCGRTDVAVISDIVVKKELNKERAKKTIVDMGLPGKHIVGTTSALTHEKDPMTMVAAIKELAQMRNDFIFLHFGTGKMQDAIEEEIKKNNLQEIYFLMGYAEDVEDYFSVFETFVMSSEEEGLGSSVLDAFVHKVPVVSTNAGGLKDLLKDDRGILCEVKDSRALANGINTMLEDPVKKSVFIDNAFYHANQHHSMRHVTDQYLELINTMSKK
jgi:glycosyltransferase involved in cell wall biosynthesis